LAAFVDAVAAVGPLPGWKVVVVGVVDEEGQSRGARYVCDQYRPDYAIIGEPSQWDRVTLGYKGSASVEITVNRPKTHSASDIENAPEAAFSLWGRILEMASEFNHERTRLFDQLTPGLQAFSSRDDGFESSATLQISTRLPPDLPPVIWYDRLKEISIPAGATVTPKGNAIPAYRADNATPLERAFLGGIRSEGGTPRYVVKTGTDDLNIVAPVWMCPALAYGPGDSSFDHTADENLPLADYIRAVEVL
jgi:LysW-gamma-L-lysine carboxypeptidase